MALLYTFIFTMFMIIDWARSSWAGAEWAPMVNVLGILMTVVILTQFTWKTVRWKPYIIWGIVCLLGAIGYYPIWYDNQGYLIVLHYFSVAVNILCIGTFVIRFVQDKVWTKMDKPRGFLGYAIAALWITMALYMCLSPMDSVWQIWFIFLFGAYYMVPMSEERKRQLFDGILNGLVLGFIFIQGWACLYRPYDRVRYVGAYPNSISNSMMYFATYIAALVRIFQWRKEEPSKKRTGWLCFYWIVLGGMLAFQLITGTRTTVLICGLSTIVFGIVCIVSNKVRGIGLKKSLCNLLLGSLLLCVLAAAAIPVEYTAIRFVPALRHHPVWWDGEYDEDSKVHSWHPIDHYLYIDFDWTIREMKDRFLFFLDASEEIEQEYFLVSSDHIASDVAPSTSWVEQLIGHKGAMETMSIRLAVYIRYLENLNWTGHKIEEGFFTFSSGYQTLHAQNMWIQMLFYYGIPAGILLMLLTVLLVVKAVRNVWKEPTNSWYLFALLAYIALFGCGIVEAVWYPGQIYLSLLFLSQKDLKESPDAIS